MNITILAIDIAKNIFQLHGNDKFGKCSYKRRIKRENLLPTIANIAKCTIVMESCGGSNYWYRYPRAEPVVLMRQSRCITSLCPTNQT